MTFLRLNTDSMDFIELFSETLTLPVHATLLYVTQTFVTHQQTTYKTELNFAALQRSFSHIHTHTHQTRTHTCNTFNDLRSISFGSPQNRVDSGYRYSLIKYLVCEQFPLNSNANLEQTNYSFL